MAWKALLQMAIALLMVPLGVIVFSLVALVIIVLLDLLGLYGSY